MENWLPSLFYSREGLSSLRPFKILKGSMNPCKIPESTLTPSIIKEFGSAFLIVKETPVSSTIYKFLTH